MIHGYSSTTLIQTVAKCYYNYDHHQNSLVDNFNLSSIADAATGMSTPTINNDFADTNYVMVDGTADTGTNNQCPHLFMASDRVTKAVSTCGIDAGNASAGAYVDCHQLVVFFGDLA